VLAIVVFSVSMGHIANDAFEKFRYQFSAFAAERLKLLLETKHLYQKVSLLPEELLASLSPARVEKQVMAPIVIEDEKDLFERQAAAFFQGRLSITEKQLFDTTNRPTPCLVVGNVKLFCSTCGGREAFRPIWFSDVTNELVMENAKQGVAGIPQTFKIRFNTNTFQLFYLIFQCQRCEGVPEAFLVKRHDMDLVVEGRSPLEHVELPTFIPREEKKWFRDAVVAFQTGKILAALFYLRTFIEQFARRKTGTQNDKKTGDEIMSAYADTIPMNLRDTMPSLAEWYDKLSAALHGAKEDSELFESAREKIEEHFDIRRVHKLDSKIAATPTKEAKQQDQSSEL
jgi:hypothetical protein